MNRLPREFVVTCGIIAFVAALSGCANIETSGPAQPSASRNGSSSNAVQASEPTHAPADQDLRDAMAFPTGNRNTSDLLVEQIGPKEVRLGHPYTYQLRVTNLLNRPVTGIVLRQRLPESFNLSSSDATTQPSQNGQERLVIGDLGPHQSKTIQLSGVPTEPGTLDTCLTAEYNPPTLCTHVSVVNPTLKIVKEVPSQADICQEIPFHYTVSNIGSGTAREVVLQDTLPEGLQTTDGQKAISVNLGDIPQGQSRTVTAHLKAAKAGDFSSRALARSEGDEAQTDPVSVSVRQPKLAIRVTGPDQEYVTEPVTYKVSITNEGDAPARNVTVSFAPQGQAQFVNLTGTDGARLPARNAGGGDNLGTIDPGKTLDVNATFRPQQGGPLSVKATAAANCAPSVSSNVQTNILTLPALLLEAVDVKDPVRVGNNVVYNIKVTNQGTAPDSEIRVKAILPDSEQYVSAGGASDVTNEGQTITFAPVPTLAPKQSVTWQVTVKATKPDDARFRVEMTSKSLTKPGVKEEPTRLY